MNKNSVKLDYSNTIVYKIYCKNPEIKPVYIGHTVNFVNRMTSHKTCCNSNSNKKLYQFMRNNGGWDNWEMDEIAKYNCKNKCEALAYEQYHYEQFADTLNVKRPVVNKTHCANCVEFYKSNKLSLINGIASEENIDFICSQCDFSCKKRGDWTRHLVTKKHLKVIELVNTNASRNICNCGKIYKHLPSLYKHKRTCTQDNSTPKYLKLVEPIIASTDDEFNTAFVNKYKLFNQMIEAERKLFLQRKTMLA